MLLNMKYGIDSSALEHCRRIKLVYTDCKQCYVRVILYPAAKVLYMKFTIYMKFRNLEFRIQLYVAEIIKFKNTVTSDWFCEV